MLILLCAKRMFSTWVRVFIRKWCTLQNVCFPSFRAWWVVGSFGVPSLMAYTMMSFVNAFGEHVHTDSRFVHVRMLSLTRCFCLTLSLLAMYCYYDHTLLMTVPLNFLVHAYFRQQQAPLSFPRHWYRGIQHCSQCLCWNMASSFLAKVAVALVLYVV